MTDVYGERVAWWVKKLRQGVVGMPWDRLVMLHREMYIDLYGFQYDGETFFSVPSEMVAAYPLITLVFADIARTRGKSLSDDDLQEVSRVLVQHNYLQAGRKDFYVYSDLVPMLRDTDVPDVMANEVRFPFEAFSVVFRQGTLRGRGAKMDRIFVSCPDGVQVIGFLASDTHEAAPTFTAALLPELKLGQILEDTRNLVDDSPLQTAAQQTARDATRLLFNLLLYINCENADMQQDTSRADALREKLAEFKSKTRKTRKQKFLEKEYAEARRRHIYLVGKNIVADELYGVKPRNEAGRKILKRFRVRGHFRNQPCGPERSQVRRRWIAPHWKGPDLAELINNGYVVKTGGKNDNA